MTMAAAERDVAAFELEAVTPSAARVLRAQGIPPDVSPNWRTLDLVDDAGEIFRRCVRPTGVWVAIPLPEFLEVLAGEGRNASATPVESTVRKADDLALFAVTVGAELPQAITELFDKQEPALASMLDAYASEAAELAADQVETRFVEYLAGKGRFAAGSAALRYSPGYCGWHVSGQRRLFDYLRPEPEGIALRESCLMQPLKSISGVVISGRREIFDFDNDFDFCEECSSWTCRERIRAALEGKLDAAT